MVTPRSRNDLVAPARRTVPSESCDLDAPGHGRARRRLRDRGPELHARILRVDRRAAIEAPLPAAPVEHEWSGRRRLEVTQDPHPDRGVEGDRPERRALVVVGEDLGRRRAVERPAACAVLTHPHAVTVAAAVDGDRGTDRRGAGGDGGRRERRLRGLGRGRRRPGDDDADREERHGDVHRRAGSRSILGERHEVPCAAGTKHARCILSTAMGPTGHGAASRWAYRTATLSIWNSIVSWGMGRRGRPPA